MKLRWAHLCSRYTLNFVSTQIVRPIQAITRDLNQSRTFPECSVVLSLETTANDQPAVARLTMGRRGATKTEIAEASLKWGRLSDETPLFARVAFELHGLEVPGYGEWSFEIQSESGEPVGHVPYKVIPSIPTEAALRPPRRDPNRPLIDIVWAHLLGNFDKERFRALEIGEILDFLPIPAPLRPTMLPANCAFAVHLGAPLDFRPDHRLTIEIHAAGQEMQGHGQQNTFRPIAGDRTQCTTYVSMAGMILYPGKNTIRFGLDGPPLGERDYFVTPLPPG
jgi:hypothetical protein